MPTTADWALLAAPPLALISGAYRRFGNLVKTNKWNDLCQCNADPTPVCGDETNVSVSLQYGGDFGGSYTFGTKIKILTAGTITAARFQGSGRSSQNTNPRFRLLKLPSTVLVDTHVSVPTTSGMHDTSIGPFTTAVNDEYIVYWDNAVGDALLYYSGVSMPFTNGSVQVEAGYGTTSNGDHTAVTSGGDAAQHWAQVVHCIPNSPTIPPDPTTPPPPTGYPTPPGPASCASYSDICAAIAALAAKLDATRGLVEVIQRYHVPMAYNAAAAQTGLTGQGSFAISRAIGFQLTVQTTPAAQKSLPGDPAYLWDLGWMAISDPSGMVREQRITRSSMTWLPDDCQLATLFTYYLNAGVTVSVVPLLAEP